MQIVIDDFLLALSNVLVRHNRSVVLSSESCVYYCNHYFILLRVKKNTVAQLYIRSAENTSSGVLQLEAFRGR